MNNNAVYLVSTLRHLHFSMALAFENSDENAHLIITGSNISEEVLHKLRASELSPFISMIRIEMYIGETKKKLKDFRHIQQQMSDYLVPLMPSKCFVGNDRKDYAQWFMNFSTKLNSDCVRYYLDEGTASMVPYSKTSRSIVDKLEGFIKKLLFGFWFSMPPAIGASKYIDFAYLIFPSLAHKYLKNKNILEFERKWLLNTSLLKLLSEIGGLSTAELGELTRITTVFVLPRKKLINRFYGGIPQLKNILQSYANSSNCVGLKYHPADSDGISELEQGIDHLVRLPNTLSLEMLLGFLPANLTLIGDISSALFTVKWLNPETTVYSISGGAINIDKKWLPLLKKVNIELKIIESSI